MPRQSLLAANIRENQVGRLLETERLHWRLDGEVRHYHSLTRGWVAGELFRRLHPARLTLGEFFRQEISGRLGADIYLGLQETEMSRVVDVEMTSWLRPLLANWLPRSLGRRDDLGLPDLARCVGRELWNSRTGHRPAPPIQVRYSQGGLNLVGSTPAIKTLQLKASLWDEIPISRDICFLLMCLFGMRALIISCMEATHPNVP